MILHCRIEIEIEIEIGIEIGIRLWGSFSQFVYSDVNHNFLRPPCCIPRWA